MEVILLKNVDKLGEEGEIVEVKPGYGRNYLIPQGLARMATKGILKQRREEERQAARRVAHQKENAQEIAEELKDIEVDIRAKVGEEDRIFGTVTTQQIALELAKQGLDVDRRTIELPEDIRRLGVYRATIDLHEEVTAKLTVRVVPEEEEEA